MVPFRLCCVGNFGDGAEGGARGWFVACTLGRGASVGSVVRGDPLGSSVGMWATILGAASRGVEGRHKSVTGCAPCGPMAAGGVA